MCFQYVGRFGLILSVIYFQQTVQVKARKIDFDSVQRRERNISAEDIISKIDPTHSFREQIDKLRELYCLGEEQVYFDDKFLLALLWNIVILQFLM